MRCRKLSSRSPRVKCVGAQRIRRARVRAHAQEQREIILLSPSLLSPLGSLPSPWQNGGFSYPGKHLDSQLGRLDEEIQTLRDKVVVLSAAFASTPAQKQGALNAGAECLGGRSDGKELGNWAKTDVGQQPETDDAESNTLSDQSTQIVSPNPEEAHEDEDPRYAQECTIVVHNDDPETTHAHARDDVGGSRTSGVSNADIVYTPTKSGFELAAPGRAGRPLQLQGAQAVLSRQQQKAVKGAHRHRQSKLVTELVPDDVPLVSFHDVPLVSFHDNSSVSANCTNDGESIGGNVEYHVFDQDEMVRMDEKRMEAELAALNLAIQNLAFQNANDEAELAALNLAIQNANDRQQHDVFHNAIQDGGADYDENSAHRPTLETCVDRREWETCVDRRAQETYGRAQGGNSGQGITNAAVQWSPPVHYTRPSRD